MLAFEIVVLVVCVLTAVIGGLLFTRAGRLYDQIGRMGGLSMTHEGELSDRARDVIRREVREMLGALSTVRDERAELRAAAERRAATELRAAADRRAARDRPSARRI